MCVTLALLASQTLAGSNLPQKSRNAAAYGRSDTLRDTRRQTATCTPNSDEYWNRTSALLCSEDYHRAVRAEIERSVCKNFFYSREFFDDVEDSCEHPIDERSDVNANCSTNCSLTQLYYVYCESNEEEIKKIDRECGVTDSYACLFDDEESCNAKEPYYFFYKIHEECNTTESVSIQNGACSSGCKQALEALKDMSGCCLASFLKDNLWFEDDEEKFLFDLYSTCGVEIPEICSGLPSDDILECAHPSNPGDNAKAVNSKFLLISMIVIMAKIAKLE